MLVEGVLQSRPVFIQTGSARGDLGRLTQCELSGSGARAFGTVICLEDAEGIPVRSRVRARGYFIKVRGYRTNTGETGAGPLIVARRLELVHPPASGLGGELLSSTSGSTLIVVATACLAVIWLLLRRGLRPPPSVASRARTPRNRESIASDDDFAWLNEQPTDDNGPSDR